MKHVNGPVAAGRRGFLRGAVGASLGVVGVVAGGCRQAEESNERPIDVAGYDYDRVRAIIDGQVGIEDATVAFHRSNIYALNRAAFGPERTYTVTEIGLIPYLQKYVNEDFRAYTLIPVFISRTFRHRNIYVHTDAGIDKPEDLRGKRVGTPGYGFSSNTWIRGFLLDEYGVEADSMQWIETTESSDGAQLHPGLDRGFLSDDFPLTKGPEGVDESELLLSGGCDALITAITPRAFEEGKPEIRQLFPDHRSVEREYFKKTGVFPIMHSVAVRVDDIQQDPGLPRAVFEMYCKAKWKAYANLESKTALKVTLPWVGAELDETRELMGENYWPYGIAANRQELELAVRYSHEQGLIRNSVPFEELFHPSTLDLPEVQG
jgi:4,5-dihydroxyphthalate decarboxylase